MKTTQQTILQYDILTLIPKAETSISKKSQNTSTLILISRVGTSISKNFTRS